MSIQKKSENCLETKFNTKCFSSIVELFERKNLKYLSNLFNKSNVECDLKNKELFLTYLDFNKEIYSEFSPDYMVCVSLVEFEHEIIDNRISIIHKACMQYSRYNLIRNIFWNYDNEKCKEDMNKLIKYDIIFGLCNVINLEYLNKIDMGKKIIKNEIYVNVYILFSNN